MSDRFEITIFEMLDAVQKVCLIVHSARYLSYSTYRNSLIESLVYFYSILLIENCNQQRRIVFSKL